MKRRLCASATGLLMAFSMGQAGAVTVSGATVDFTFDDALLGLFGGYSVVGDTLRFQPTEFEVVARPGSGFGAEEPGEEEEEEEGSIAGFDFAGQTATRITITAKGPKPLYSVRLTQAGEYEISDAGEVVVGGQAEIGDDVRAIDQGFSNADDEVRDVWSLTESFQGLGLSSATLILDSSLIGFVYDDDDDALARIALNVVSIDATVVPVPAAVWLLGSAMVGLNGVARRSRPDAASAG